MSVPITKPTVGASNGTWGTEANAVFDALNAADYFAYKTADTSRASTAALADDNHLVTASLPVGTYVVNGLYVVSGILAGSFRSAWASAGTATGFRAGSGPSLRTTDATGAGTAAVTVGVNRAAAAGGTNTTMTSAAQYGTDGASWSMIQESGVVVVTVAGALKMQWGQSSSNATATILRAGSYLWARQVA